MVIVCHYRIYPVRMVCGHQIESEQRFVACDNHEGVPSKWESHKRTNPAMIARRMGSGSVEEMVGAGKGRMGKEKVRVVAMETKVTGVRHAFKSCYKFRDEIVQYSLILCLPTLTP
jgi:hypothetical protein